MLQEIKARLVSEPKYIIDILEFYEFSNIHMLHSEIRCAICEGHNGNSIRIRLRNNDALFVTDYGRNITCDIISYIMKVRNVDFRNVIDTIKLSLGITDWYVEKKESIFGGFYDRIRNKDQDEYIKTYDDSVLEKYVPCANKRFIKDNIDICTQKHFNIRYDVVSQRIIIPIYDSFGSLMGIKARANWEVNDDESKYLYLIPCRMSQTLYGYSENYHNIINGTVYIYESEKSVMQSYAFGIHNSIALGSNSLSRTQAKLIAGLHPTKVVFMLDEGLDIDITFKNINQLLKYLKMTDCEIAFWNYNKTENIISKSSATDLGKEKFKEIIKNDIEVVHSV